MPLPTIEVIGLVLAYIGGDRNMWCSVLIQANTVGANMLFFDPVLPLVGGVANAGSLPRVLAAWLLGRTLKHVRQLARPCLLGSSSTPDPHTRRLSIDPSKTRH